MITYEPTAGTHIKWAFAESIVLAKAGNDVVQFSFNGTRLTSGPNDDVEALYTQWQTARDRERTERLACEMAALPGLVADLGQTVAWLVRVSAYDYLPTFDAAAVAQQLEAAGYVAGEHVGNPPEWFSTSERIGRYAVGQCISYLRAGHGVGPVRLFSERYEAILIAK